MTVNLQEKADNYGQYGLLISPTWLQGEFGRGWWVSLGVNKDRLRDKIVQVVRMSLLDYCQNDALPFHGHERCLERGFNFFTSTQESDDSYRTWLLEGWTRWASAGTVQSVISGIAHAIQIPENEVFVLEAEHHDPTTYGLPSGDSNFSYFDSNLDYWNRYRIVIGSTLAYPWQLASSNYWDATTWNGALWDVTAPISFVQQILDAACKWDSCYSVLDGLYLAGTNSFVWGSVSTNAAQVISGWTWGAVYIWGSSGVEFISGEGLKCKEGC